jgi:hypothetical protein
LFSAELDLLIARFILASAICKVIEGNLLIIGSPSVRKDRIGRDDVVANLCKTIIPSVAAS